MDDVLQGNWKQLRGYLKEWWGKLTDDDVMKINGQRDKLVGILQTRYGWERNRAETEVNERLTEFVSSMRETIR